MYAYLLDETKLTQQNQQVSWIHSKKSQIFPSVGLQSHSGGGLFN